MGDLGEIECVKAAMVGLAVSAHQSGAVYRQHHMQIIQRHILYQHVISPLQETGIHGKHRDKALLGHTARHGHRVSLCNAHVK